MIKGNLLSQIQKKKLEPILRKNLFAQQVDKFKIYLDPETARDLDDALSIKKIQDGIYEIGI